MGIKFGGSPKVQNESIVQTNLVLQLDAGYNGSFSDTTSSTITDLTGNNNGTIVGNTSIFTRRHGGGIWMPRGTSTYITTDTTRTDFTTSNEISIGYWFTPQAYTAVNYGFLCFGDSVGDLTNWISFQNDSSSGLMKIYINNGNRFTGITTTLGEAVYICLTYSSNLWTLYRNGQQVNTYTGGIGTTGGPRLYLGGGSTGGTEDMIFHQIHIYDDLLSADEVLKNYNITRYRFNN